MRAIVCVATLLVSASFISTAKPSFGLQDAIKGAFWVIQHELQQDDPLLIGRNFVEILGQKVFIGSASLSGQSSISLEDLTVNEAVGDAFGLLSMNKLTATINEVAIDAFIVNFGLRFTE
ncbi:uncharacterized protein LOC112905863 [Agrilus planipennis]|uniref:Uncharacterized protein LOC112905863 n=1 Tax=Agrilus planipennis TaxID=224129 RepID=A0A7F5RFX0_AGRPL|nr:uncharacterized protein LOC112905863 [Agrilus planipennis]